MFNNFMSGYARVIDAHNLVKHFPIIGQEKITIKYKTPGFNKNMKELSFDIYSLEGRTKSDNLAIELSTALMTEQVLTLFFLHKSKAANVSAVSPD